MNLCTDVLYLHVPTVYSDKNGGKGVKHRAHSLLNGQRVRAGDGVAIEKGEELAESVKEGPVGKQADTLVGVHRARRGVIVGGVGFSVGGGSFVWIGV